MFKNYFTSIYFWFYKIPLVVTSNTALNSHGAPIATVNIKYLKVLKINVVLVEYSAVQLSKMMIHVDSFSK